MTYYHIIPQHDDAEHTIDASCICNPTVKGQVVRHISFDNREEQEKESGRPLGNKTWAVITQ